MHHRGRPAGPLLLLPLALALPACSPPPPAAPPVVTVCPPAPPPPVCPTPAATAATAAKPLGIDIPKAADFDVAKLILGVQISASGDVRVDGEATPTDEEIREHVRRAVQRAHGDLRAVLSADRSVTHGHVIHVLDLMKQSGVTRIAFGVAAPGP